ncbi:putative calcium-transporting ATPase 13 [Spatholobus suberectus]|nr:putative calcium-transporting ATPase 13 [Spatholobus suberectus]
MSQATTSSAGGDGANIELGATLLGATITRGKYTRIWRKSLYVGLFISVKKPTTSTGNHESPPSPLSSVPYTSLPPARTFSSKSYVAIDIRDVEECISSDIARIVKDQDLKSLQELGGVDFVSTVLGSQRQHSEPEEGTIDDGNTTIPLPVLGATKFLLSSCKCHRCTILMLLISAGLSFAIEFKQEGPKHGWHDGVAIGFAVLLLVAGDSVANFQRERKMLKLAKRKNELEFRVKRGQESLMVPISDIVVGNTVCLWPGDEVPADGLLVSDGILVLAEPEAIKSKHDHPFLISGSKVIGGQGRMVVTSVRNQMNLAEIGTCNFERRGLLESLIEKPISYVDIAALFISVLVALVVFIRLICGKDGNNGGLPEMKGKVSISCLMEALERVFLRPQGRVSILTGLVTVTILCVQHGMPLVVTISLKYKIDKVVPNEDAVLNDLSACTTMGLVTVICIDVSGGLVSKPMEVSRIWMGEKDISKVEGSEADQPVLDMLKQGVGLSVLAPEISLSPLSNSLVDWAEKTWEMNMRSFTEENFDILKLSKLNSDKEGSGILVRKVGDNGQVLHWHWSGAASTILEMCSLYYDGKGKTHAMVNQKIKLGQVIKEMEDSGLKPIGFAYRSTDAEELEQEELILLGLIGLKYTSQESIKPALENLRTAANVQIKLVSEDDIMVVKGLACDLGLELELDHDNVLEGKELQDLNEEARLDKVDRALVIGNFSPEDKVLMVRCLQEKGKVVAYIGTRLMTSHTSVLKVADVGIVHDSLSTIVDRDRCDISIKCFSALKPIVMTGRSKYHNIEKFIQLQLTFTISGLVITLITTIFTGDSPLAAFQLIWVNVLVCLLGGLMMVMKLTSEEQLAKQPSDHRNRPIITKEIWKNIVIQVLYQVSVSMTLEFGGHVTDRERKVRETMIFNTFLLCQLFNLLNTIQLLKKEVLKVVVQSFCFLGALGGCFLVQVLVIEYAEGLAGCMRLNATRWAICVLIGALSWALEWTLKNILPVILSPSTNYASESITSPSFYLSPAFPFLLMLLVLPVGLIFSQIGMSMTFR